MNEDEWFPYEDIVGLPHPVSKRHKPMDISVRAAQFAPFAALTGREEEPDVADVTDVAEETDRKNYLTNTFEAVPSE